MNPYIGESCLRIDGRNYRLKLSLGALAALEARLDEDNLSSLVARFGSNRFSSNDIIAVLEAGLYGGENDDVNLSVAVIEGGASKAACVAVELLGNAFGNWMET